MPAANHLESFLGKQVAKPLCHFEFDGFLVGQKTAKNGNLLSGLHCVLLAARLLLDDFFGIHVLAADLQSVKPAN
jgi:hypothetical protein